MSRQQQEQQTCTDVQQLNCLETNGKLGESFFFQLFKWQHLPAKQNTSNSRLFVYFYKNLHLSSSHQYICILLNVPSH